MADIILPVRFRDAEARSSVDRLQQAINALRTDVQQLGIAFQSATGPATRFGSAAATGLARAHASSSGLLANVRSLRGAFTGLFVGGGLALAVRSFARLNDQATNTRSLLRQITDSSAELERSQAAIYQLALDLRTPVQAITTLYSRTALALGDAYDPARVEQFTRAIAQLGRATGATEQEFVNATRQLVQGLGSGKLAGDELRGVLEGLPAVGRELARELGVPFGQIRQLGRTGQLTPRVVFDALSGSGVGERAESAFAEVGLTFGQVFDQFITELQREFGALEQTGTVLENLQEVLIGKLDENGERTGGLTNAIVGLTSAVTSLVSFLGIGGTALGLTGVIGAQAGIGALSSRRRNIFGGSQNITALLAGLGAETSDDVVRLTRSGAITLTKPETEFGERRFRVGNRAVYDRFVAEVGVRRADAAFGALQERGARDFTALRDTLRYLDRVGGAGTAGLGRTVSRSPIATAFRAVPLPLPVKLAAIGVGVITSLAAIFSAEAPEEGSRVRLRSDERTRRGGLTFDGLADFVNPSGRPGSRRVRLRQQRPPILSPFAPDISLAGERAARVTGPPTLEELVNDAVSASIPGAWGRFINRYENQRSEVDDLLDRLARDRERELQSILFIGNENSRAVELFDAFDSPLRDGEIPTARRTRDRNDLDLTIAEVIRIGDEYERQFDELERQSEQTARDVRSEWLNTFADIGSFARGIFDSLDGSTDGLIRAALELGRILVRLDVARERESGVTPSNATVFARALLGGVPAFHEGRLPSNFNDNREMAAIVRRNETILTPQQLQSVAGAGGGRGNVYVDQKVEQVISDDAVLDVLRRRGFEAGMYLQGAV